MWYAWGNIFAIESSPYNPIIKERLFDITMIIKKGTLYSLLAAILMLLK